MGRLFGTDGARGVANSELTCELAMKIGRATAMVLTDSTHKRPRVLIGMDTRASSEMLEAAISAGLFSVGADVLLLGVVPTPAVAFLVQKYQYDAGIMISASHNPCEYNGIKIFKSDGYKLPDALEEEIEAIILDETVVPPVKIGGDVGRVTTSEMPIFDYITHLCSTVDYRFNNMKIALDCSSGQRLERWGDVILIRPDPQVIWKTEKTHPLWYKAHAVYNRSSSGGGKWDIRRKIPDAWKIKYGDLSFMVKPMGFKHTGVFPEQAVNWDMTAEIIRKERRPLRVLNLFAYTGAATISALNAGAHVTHVDASKGMVAWAKENAAVSGLANEPVRWLVDDCMKFVEREIRRGNKYDIIIMDPPSYGRGPGGEVWKLEDAVYDFASLCTAVLSDDPVMVLINSYTTGLSASVMQYILGSTVSPLFGGKVTSDEIGLPVTASGLVLPCGASAVWRR